MSNEARGINSKPLQQLRTDLFFLSLAFWCFCNHPGNHLNSSPFSRSQPCFLCCFSSPICRLYHSKCQFVGISVRHLRQGLRARLGLLWQLGWHPYCCLLEGSARVKEHGCRHEVQRRHTGLQRATMEKGGLSTANHSMAAREHGTMFGIEMTFDPLGFPSRQLSSGRSFCFLPQGVNVNNGTFTTRETNVLLRG